MNKVTAEELNSALKNMPDSDLKVFVDNINPGIFEKMSSLGLTPAGLSAHLKTLSTDQIAQFRDKISPEMWDQLFLAGINSQAKSLILTDPQWGLLIAGLIKLVVLAFVLERGLAVLFEQRVFIGLERQFGMRPELVYGEVPKSTPSQENVRSTLKNLIAFLAAGAACYTFDFNILAGIFPNSNHTFWGQALTALIITGGAQGAITLMQSVLGLRGSIRKAGVETMEATAQKAKTNAQAEAISAKVKEEKAMNEKIGMAIKKLLADQEKTGTSLAIAADKTEIEINKILDGTMPVGEPVKDKIAVFFNISKEEIFGK